MGSQIDILSQAAAYMVDSWQRSVLFLDLLRQRGNAAKVQEASHAPNVLNFSAELVVDGRHLECPVNYMLLRILPDDGHVLDPKKRPFVIFDPRAGQGPGVGGMKKESEVGIALAKGHPVYFVSFLPEPVPGQTVLDVCDAEALFLEEIIKQHPESEKPCLIGNCQAGWQIALMSALHPDLAGVLILAAAPLSYWSGKRGESVGRYAAGMTGGSWVNALCSDLGNGSFDGAWLVSAFEGNSPAHAFWNKPYNLYSKVDTEGPRYLSFERWWGSPTLLDGKEMQFVADELFIGNHLSQSKIHSRDGYRADLRNIKSPIVIFCSRGDDITPPAQALGWVHELYEKDEDLTASGQTIIYCLHEDVGHLGIFVSASVANKEHHKFISHIDFIEALPPGLYEARFLRKEEGMDNAALIDDEYILRFERRCLQDIRAFGVNNEEENQRFMAVSRLSENLLGMYSTFVSPLLRQFVTEDVAKEIRRWHPVRVPFWFMSDENPLCANLATMATQIKMDRAPAQENNMFVIAQDNAATTWGQMLNFANEMKNNILEDSFYQIYGNPFLQASLGLRTSHPHAAPHPARDVQVETVRRSQRDALMEKIAFGGVAEAVIRGLLFVSRAERAVDEREYVMLKYLHAKSDLMPDLSQDEFKNMIRLQHTFLVWDEDAAIKALPELLKKHKKQAEEVLADIRSVIDASGAPTAKEAERLQVLEAIFKSI